MELLIFLGLVAFVLVALVRAAGQNKRYMQMTDPRLCRSCALPHPPFAHFCRHCGRKLLH